MPSICCGLKTKVNLHNIADRWLGCNMKVISHKICLFWFSAVVDCYICPGKETSVSSEECFQCNLCNRLISKCHSRQSNDLHISFQLLFQFDSEVPEIFKCLNCCHIIPTTSTTAKQTHRHIQSIQLTCHCFPQGNPFVNVVKHWLG